MAHTNYPESLDLECATYVFQVIRERTIVENKVKFANCIWSLTGFLLKTVVGVPVEGHATAILPLQPEEESVLQQVCDECSSMMAEPISLTDPDPIAGFDIGSLITLIPMILTLLQALGIRWKGKKE